MGDRTRSPIELVKLYHEDEPAWVERHIALLEEGRVEEIDRENLVDLLTSLSRRDRGEVREHMIVLLLHALKIVARPDKHRSGWNSAVIERIDAIEDALRTAPSLKDIAPEMLARAYPSAVARAAAETGVPASGFPRTPPWTLDELLTYVPPDPPPARTRYRKRGIGGSASPARGGSRPF